jgi:hypothetical protein
VSEYGITDTGADSCAGGSPATTGFGGCGASGRRIFHIAAAEAGPDAGEGLGTSGREGKFGADGTALGAGCRGRAPPFTAWGPITAIGCSTGDRVVGSGDGGGVATAAIRTHRGFCGHHTKLTTRGQLCNESSRFISTGAAAGLPGCANGTSSSSSDGSSLSSTVSSYHRTHASPSSELHGNQFWESVLLRVYACGGRVWLPDQAPLRASLSGTEIQAQQKT